VQVHEYVAEYLGPTALGFADEFVLRKRMDTVEVRAAHRQTDRHNTDRQPDRHRHTDTHIHMHIHTDTHRKTQKHIHTQTDTDTQTPFHRDGNGRGAPRTHGAVARRSGYTRSCRFTRRHFQ
jgi:hypothetical protein